MRATARRLISCHGELARVLNELDAEIADAEEIDYDYENNLRDVISRLDVADNIIMGMIDRLRGMLSADDKS